MEISSTTFCSFVKKLQQYFLTGKNLAREEKCILPPPWCKQVSENNSKLPNSEIWENIFHDNCILTLAFSHTQGEPKKHGTLLLSIFSQVIDRFSNFFTGTLCGQFAITHLLHIPPHHKCVSTLPCEISMKYALITIITNKHFGKIEKSTSDQHCSEWSVDTKLCGSNTV